MAATKIDKPHCEPQYIYNDDSDEHPPQFLAIAEPVPLGDVTELFSAPVGEDTRSEYVRLTLANGDLLVGVFPRGEHYDAFRSQAPMPRPEQPVRKKLSRFLRKSGVLPLPVGTVVSLSRDGTPLLIGEVSLTDDAAYVYTLLGSKKLGSSNTEDKYYHMSSSDFRVASLPTPRSLRLLQSLIDGE